MLISSVCHQVIKMSTQHLYLIEHNEGQLYFYGDLIDAVARCEELKHEDRTRVMLFQEKHDKGILHREQVWVYETDDAPEKYDGWFKGDRYL